MTKAGSAKSVDQVALARAKAQNLARDIARVVTHTDPPPEAIRERKKLERNLARWLPYYFPEVFYLPFSPDHKDALKIMQEAATKGGQFVLAMPRGAGKTMMTRGAALFCVLTGRRKYVVNVGATAELATETIKWIIRVLRENDRLHEHYPHVTTYVRASEGKAIKARFMLRCDMKPIDMEFSKGSIYLPCPTTEGQTDSNGIVTRAAAKGYPSNGAAIESEGLTGAIRGRTRSTKTGEQLRPDFVIIDDPQTRESAESEAQCRQRERIITGDILGLAGPTKRIAAVMPCTVVRDGDLTSRFLNRANYPEWQGKLTPMVAEWPEAQETLWVEYANRKQEYGDAEATSFYRRNRRAMDKGAVVTWRHRIEEGDISALQTAQNILLRTREQFWAEYQNAPRSDEISVYSLTAEDLLATTEGDRRPGDVPEWASVVTIATDVNPTYALTTIVRAHAVNTRSAVIWYGVHRLAVPSGAPDIQRSAMIAQALQAHGKELAAMPFGGNVDIWGIDGGGSPQNTIIDFAAGSGRSTGLRAVCMFGRAWKYVRPAKADVEYLHAFLRHKHGRQWLIWNADYFREAAQRAWRGAYGAAGSVSLPAGKHHEFAEQICREKLAGKAPINDMWVYDWRTAPGAHDYGDCMAMTEALAGVLGIHGEARITSKRIKVLR